MTSDPDKLDDTMMSALLDWRHAQADRGRKNCRSRG